jgi:hypothetical protein
MQYTRQTAAAARDDGFFIPDLCAPQTVFLAVLLAELVVLLHVLALGPLVAFDWRALAIGSLFVQWNSLLCIALICALRRHLQAQSPHWPPASVSPPWSRSPCCPPWRSICVYPVLWPARAALETGCCAIRCWR